MSFPNIKGFSVRNLKYMKSFYNEYKDDEEFVQLVAQIPWKHNITLIEKVKDKEIQEKLAIKEDTNTPLDIID